MTVITGRKTSLAGPFREGGEGVADFGDVDKTRARSYINSAFEALDVTQFRHVWGQQTFGARTAPPSR